MDLSKLNVSDKTGEAVRSLVTVHRAPGGTVITPNSLVGWPTNFVATTGPLLADGTLDPAKTIVFRGHTSGATVIIDALAPGYADTFGNAVGDVVVIKPNTWAQDTLIDAVRVALEDSGVPKNTSLNPTGAMTSYAGFVAPSGWLFCDGSAVSRSTYADLFALLNPTIGTFSVTIASPAVVTATAHGLETSDSVYLTTTGALPTGLTANTRYFAIKVTADTFRLATSQANADAGTAINTSGSQSGVHTLKRTPYGVGDGSTTFTLPDMKGRVPVGLDTSQTEFNTLGKTGGQKTVQAHTHELRKVATVNALTANWQLANSTSFSLNTGDGGAGYHSTHTAGSGVNNMNPYSALNHIIKT